MLANKRTQALLDAFIQNPVSSVIVQGSSGSNSSEIVTYICNTLLTHKNNVIIVKPPKLTIGVDQIRELKRSLTTKIGGTQIGRIGVIQDAHTMTNEAQNALLKLVEEPVKNTLIILQSHNAHDLLVTIRSRCQTIPVLPITRQQALEYSEKHGVLKKEGQIAYLLSNGETQLFKDIIVGEGSATANNVDEAKAYLRMKTFERIKYASKYATAESLPSLIEGLNTVASAALRSSKGSSTKQWTRVLSTCQQSQKSILTNTPPKLIYLKLSTSI